MQIHQGIRFSEATTPPAAWGGVFAMTLCVFVLIAAEFLPVSLLTPIAGELQMTEGQAGQAIAVSGVFAVLTSLLIASVSRRINRKTLLVCLTAVMLASGLMVAVAPSPGVFMTGRALLGIAVGGFWSMSTATVMRLVPEDAVPKALAILNGGNALAATIAAPLGSFLGSYIGWRGAFVAVVPLTAIALGWQLLSLPSMPNAHAARSTNVLRLLAKPTVCFGMGAIFFLFMGQFALFTYVRPFLESVTRVSANTLSLVLLVIGVTGLIGTILIGALLKRSLYAVVITIPLLMAVIAVALMVFGGWLAGAALLLGSWGLIGTPAPVGWGTWLSRTLPNDAEAGGGLMVATIQFAIALGAGFGGWLFDAIGHRATFGFSAGLLAIAALLAMAAARTGPLRRLTPVAPVG
jgi:predicted MFS family arabinose efflux permease